MKRTKEQQKTESGERLRTTGQEVNRSSRDRGKSARVTTELQGEHGNQKLQQFLREGLLQPKLAIGHSRDEYEREADRIASDVMRMRSSDLRRATNEESVSNSEGPQAQNQVQKAPSTSGESKVAPEVERSIRTSNGNGRSLTASERSFFEPRFGADFGNVTIHDDAEAARKTEAINAKAFTFGSDIYLGGDQQPNTRASRELLAHELTHVVQQQRTKGDQQSFERSANPRLSTGREDVLQRQTEPANENTMTFSIAPWPSGMQGLIPGGTLVSSIDLRPIHRALRTNNGRDWDSQFPPNHSPEVPIGTNQDWWFENLDNMNSFTQYDLPGLQSTMLDISPWMEIKAEITEYEHLRSLGGDQNIQMGESGTGGASISSTRSRTQGSSASLGGEGGSEGGSVTGELGGSQSRTEGRTLTRQGTRGGSVSGDTMEQFAVTLRVTIKIDAEYDAIGASGESWYNRGGAQIYYEWDKEDHFPSRGVYSVPAVIELPSRKTSIE